LCFADFYDFMISPSMGKIKISLTSPLMTPPSNAEGGRPKKQKMHTNAKIQNASKILRGVLCKIFIHSRQKQKCDVQKHVDASICVFLKLNAFVLFRC